MDWEWIAYFCENIYYEMERIDGTILDDTADNGWGWYIFI